jgi:hypothetical protein
MKLTERGRLEDCQRLHGRTRRNLFRGCHFHLWRLCMQVLRISLLWSVQKQVILNVSSKRTMQLLSDCQSSLHAKPSTTAARQVWGRN